MLWIGLTGSMGSGKSSVADVLRQLGLPVLDADQVARQVLSPGSVGEAQVFKAFGREGLENELGDLDRKALGRMVFGHADRLHVLESIVHPHVREKVKLERRRLKESGAVAAFYDVPLLFEKGMQSDFDVIWVVDAPEAVRRERVKKRSGLTDQEIVERNSKQMDPAEKCRRAHQVIMNTGDLTELKAKVREALTTLGLPLKSS